MLRVVVAVNSADPTEPLRVLQVIEPVPKQLQLDAEKVQSGYRDYQEISFSRTALKRLYALSGLNCAELTLSSCFMGSPIGFPLAASHNRAVLSSEAVTTR